jgi:DNA-binding MarR family transcriptional regulator
VSAADEAELVDRLRIVLTQISRRIDRQVSGGGLTSTQLGVLASVANRGPIGLSELAEVERVNPTMLSRIVSKLEEGGLIQRQVDELDRRAVRVEVTAAGTLLRSELSAERSALLRARLTGLSDETIAALLYAVPALEALADELAIKIGARS